MKLQMKISQSLLNSRNRLGYTQNEVADAVSISVRWYQKIESGKRLPGTRVFIRLAVLLEIDLKDYREVVGLSDPIHSIRRKA